MIWRPSSTLLVALTTTVLVANHVDAFTAPKIMTSSRVRLSASVEEKVDSVAAISSNIEELADPMGEIPMFKNILAANRAEIAVRIMRAATELNAGTIAIYDKEDRYSQHRWGADKSFELQREAGASPISSYLDIAQIIQIAKDANVDAIHPG
jgi:hypothetical protein